MDIRDVHVLISLYSVSLEVSQCLSHTSTSAIAVVPRLVRHCGSKLTRFDAVIKVSVVQSSIRVEIND